VLSQYVRVSVQVLYHEKLTPLLRLKYHDSIADALADLGKAEVIARLRRLPEVPVPTAGGGVVSAQ
jgi:type I restriction enzyme R subunit